ncbi:hypothetical protein GUJ93_ZPchr0429g33441 [Zizania palustris]|uniref:Transcription termination and cleavage factor C-terminal domain-containing protein n=1 Tax=Zizania palustris TaxID=103762 RepID=A0A8J5QTQ1_ZIZPA|nr:hypothetical protein GUJ93_ZPchr0429g33441 [Zizania palustris]
MIDHDKERVRRMLVEKPEVTRSLFRAQVVLGMVKTPKAVCTIFRCGPTYSCATTQPSSVKATVQDHASLPQPQFPASQQNMQQPSGAFSSGSSSLASSLGIPTICLGLPACSLLHIRCIHKYLFIWFESYKCSSAHVLQQSMFHPGGNPQTSFLTGQPLLPNQPPPLPNIPPPQLYQASSHVASHYNSQNDPRNRGIHAARPEAPLTPEMEKMLVQQVLSMSPDQINMLPPEQRQQVLQLRDMLRP